VTQTVTYTDDLTGDTHTDGGELPPGWVAVNIVIDIPPLLRFGMTFHTSTLDNVHELIITKGIEYLTELDAAIIAAGGHIP
jgi:hypothetical protein